MRREGGGRKVTNGWVQIGFGGLKIWSIKEVGWYWEKRPDLLNAWLQGSAGYTRKVTDDKYFVYGAKQDPIHIRNEYLAGALEISEDIEEVYLLNPQIVTSEGEWEAWLFGAKLPGANRFRSFRELMEAERYRVLETIQVSWNWDRKQEARGQL